MTQVDPLPLTVGDSGRPRSPIGSRSRGRRLLLGALAAAVLAAAWLWLGMDGLLPFGLLIAFTTPADDEQPDGSVILTPRNAGLAVAMVAMSAIFWLWQLDLAASTLVLIGGALIALPLALEESTRDSALGRTVVVTKRSLVLSLTGMVVFVYFISNGQSFDALAVVCVVLPLVLAVFRVWWARRGQVELGLLHHPLRPQVRPHLLQALNIWLCCLLIGGLLSAGGAHYARIGFSLTGAQFNVGIAVFGAGLLLLAALALVPRRRVFLATNVVVALLSSFLAVQLTSVSVPASDAVVLDSPLTGEWFVLNGGRGTLINGHSANESNAIDFQRLGENGRTHVGGSDAPLSDYAGFGLPVLAPADGLIVGVADGYPDNQPGTNRDDANHLVIDIGGGRYVAMAHLERGSVTVAVGDVVQRGQIIAAVGNNGHSNEPHLHLQVQNTAAGSNAERTYPILFGNVQITRAGPWPWGDSDAVRTGDLVRALDE